MRKLVPVILVLSAIATLAGCDDKKGDAKPAATAAAKPKATAAPAKSAEPSGGW